MDRDWTPLESRLETSKGLYSEVTPLSKNKVYFRKECEFSLHGTFNNDPPVLTSYVRESTLQEGRQGAMVRGDEGGILDSFAIFVRVRHVSFRGVKCRIRGRVY